MVVFNVRKEISVFLCLLNIKISLIDLIWNINECNIFPSNYLSLILGGISGFKP